MSNPAVFYPPGTAGGGSTPTGTGFRHVTSGTEDGASKLVDTADVNANQITNAKLAQMASNTVKGNNTGGASDPLDLTVTQLQNLLGIPRVVCLSSDASPNSTTTGVEITGLQFASTGTGQFLVEYFIKYQSSATGTGVKFGLNHTGTAVITSESYMVGATGTADQVVGVPIATSGSASRSNTTTAPDIGPSTGVDTANADMLVTVRALLDITVDGDLELWHASETAAATTVRKGSIGKLLKGV